MRLGLGRQLHSVAQFFHAERRKAQTRFLLGQGGQQAGKLRAVQAEGRCRREVAATADAGHIEFVCPGVGRRPMLQQLAYGMATAVGHVMGCQTDGGTDACVEMGKTIETCLSPWTSAVSMTELAAGRHLTDVQRIAKAQPIVLSLSLDALTGCFDGVHG